MASSITLTWQQSDIIHHDQSKQLMEVLQHSCILSQMQSSLCLCPRHDLPPTYHKYDFALTLVPDAIWSLNPTLLSRMQVGLTLLPYVGWPQLFSNMWSRPALLQKMVLPQLMSLDAIWSQLLSQMPSGLNFCLS